MKLEGRRGIITIEHQGDTKIATKRAKDPSKKGAINKEAQILSYLKQKNIDFVPQIIDSGDGWFSYERLPGEHFKDEYGLQTPDYRRILCIKLLQRAYQLDCVGVVHGEMIRPFTNILVRSEVSNQESEIFIIDFERGVIGDDSGKNMRSYSQRLLAEGRLSLADTKSLGTMEREQIYNFLNEKVQMKDYKCNTIRSFFALCSLSRNFGLKLLALIGLDQITKYLFYNLQRGSDMLLLTPALNTGIGWSLPVPRLLVILLTIAIIGVILWAWKKKHLTAPVVLLMIAGAMGNLIDRVMIAGVRDFIDLQYRPIFNFADMYLSLAVCILLYISRKESNHRIYH